MQAAEEYLTDEALFNLPVTPDGLVPLNLLRDYIDLMSACEDTGAVTNVLLAYQPGQVQPTGVAVIRRMAKP